MKVLVFIFLALGVFGCGQEESETKEPETKGKVKKGMTKQQVIDAIGEPETIYTASSFIWWYYPEIFCADGGNCHIEIDPKTNTVVKTDEMKSKYVDTASF
jgi:outer membrane protein assembly factor BamE (lipoprotein component of BamABCDE complex)